MGPFVVLTRDTIQHVMEKTGRTKESLLEVLDEYESIGIYKVKIPIPLRPNTRLPYIN
jgi:hypothetical protein